MELIMLYVASILAGFGLLNLPEVSFLGVLDPLFDIVGALSVVVFSFGLVFKGVKSFFGK
nr:hypothetical protein [Neobacillus sp. Marseille-Q6967]